MEKKEKRLTGYLCLTGMMFVGIGLFIFSTVMGFIWVGICFMFLAIGNYWEGKN